MANAKKAVRVSKEEAVKAIKSGDRVVIPLACGEPQTFLEAMIADKDRLKNVELVGGLMKNYKFLEPGLEGSFHYRTWQCAPPIAKLVGKTVHYMPIRQGDIARLFGPDGIYPVDIGVVHVSPPDKHGYYSAGVSIGHALPAALGAKTVIAEVNEQMPRILGNCFLHRSQIDYIIESSRPLVEYATGEAIGEKERTIAQQVAELIPDGSVLQIGIGAIPTAVVNCLTNKRHLKIFGMGVDSIVDLVEAGAMDTTLDRSGLHPVVGCEFLGTKRLFEFIDDNPMVEGRSIPDCLNSLVTAKIDNFTSLQSAIELDIYGQVNIETIGGRQISAVGGSHDFLQGAYQSAGGKSILALPSTTPDGKISRIVARFAPGTVIAHPRHSVDYVVTEYGVAYLRGKTLEERAKALASIAHPSFRDELKVS